MPSKASNFDPQGNAATTPTGLQTTAELGRRRIIFLILNILTYIAMMAVAASILGTGGWTMLDMVLFVCFAVGTPWTVLGFWNALIGLWLLHGRKDAIAEVAPYAAAGDVITPVTAKTAVLMTLRNEDPARAIRGCAPSSKASMSPARARPSPISSCPIRTTTTSRTRKSWRVERVETRRQRRRPHRLPPPHRQQGL